MSTSSSIRSTAESIIGKPWLLSVVLIAVLLVTRSNFVAQHLHFAPWLRAPDATLAVFFLAGLWIASLPLIVVLLGASALADQIAFANGISDWCVTPAYWCLIPAYLAMWFGGRVCRGDQLSSPASLAKLAVVLVIATGIEFVISSGSFFLFSGYFPAMTAGEYWSKTIGYYPTYLGWAAVYVATGVALVSLVRPLRTSVAQANI